ncbi:P-loop containing nucleoside triphosphate hydrolases superfamily protein [Citrus sinensis]|uniref:P-loop containing nucleoside triphosphate hydrolases superfamily protein n=1 Tax=Citrus sinensis TaxID=2711 RepID=A0ACB8NKC1_CITSI|nr:P-loop containing nucleoside triphosphate hydrolases superfamily protein [Citrus sinensis]
MASLRRLAKTASVWRVLTASRASPRGQPRRLPHRSLEQQIRFSASEIQRPKLLDDTPGPSSIHPAILAGLFGVGALNIAYADGDQGAGTAKPSLPSESSSSYENLEEIAKKERQRIEELLKRKGMHYGSCPTFTVAVKGQKVTIKFQVPPACEIPQLIANLVSHLGLKVEEHGGGSDMGLRAWDSAVAWQLTLKPPEKQNESGGDRAQSGDMNAREGDLCILIFRSLITSDKPEIEFIKKGSLTSEELDALVSVLQLAGRREIEDTILLSLQSPEVYDDIARGTRCKFESNRPRAVLFEGPPGTGKTSCARVIANQAGAMPWQGVPLMYVPLEVVMSKYYGESERLLGKVFSLANELPNGAIIFLDEVDSFAVARDSEMHEATRRILSVLLRQIDGFEQDKKVVVIAATNRKQDLDPALISRFDSMITFGLPDHENRQEIAAQYAKHLTKAELAELATATEEMSGRDIRDVCQQAERSWASKIIRGQITKDGEQACLPPLQEYIESATNRRRSLLDAAEQSHQNINNHRTKKQPLDLC